MIKIINCENVIISECMIKRFGHGIFVSDSSKVDVRENFNGGNLQFGIFYLDSATFTIAENLQYWYKKYTFIMNKIKDLQCSM